MLVGQDSVFLPNMCFLHRNYHLAMPVSVHDLKGEEVLLQSSRSSIAIDLHEHQPGENSSVFSLLEPHTDRLT